MESKTVSIRIPFEIWKSLRRLQESGKIKSIQQAAISSFKNIIGRSK